MRVDGKDRLKHVVDHLLSHAHEEAVRLNDCDRAWSDKSDRHPWIRAFKKWNDEKLQALVRIAIDAYNDTQFETVSARSWPSRSLAVEHSNHVCCTTLSHREGTLTLYLSIHQLPTITIGIYCFMLNREI